MNTEIDTIAAIATPPGRGGIGVVRVSGPLCNEIAHELLGGAVARPREAAYVSFEQAGGSVIDRGLALRFEGPRSYTGEDTLELHGHGGPVVMNALLQRVLELGARLARPGEFTERAFLNGKLDLAQAEAVADLIDAASAAAALGAMRSLEGALSREVHAHAEALANARVQVEAGIDFADEELDLDHNERIESALVRLAEALAQTRAAAARGVLLTAGITVVIAGRPNVGKSTLLNALAGRALAIVTDVPGTTRDPLRERLTLDGVPVELIDTAGLRASTEVVERIGVERAWEHIARASVVLLMVDDRAGVEADDLAILQRLPAGARCLLVHNKCDLSEREPGVISRTANPNSVEEVPDIQLAEWAVRISAAEKRGLESLRKALKTLAGISTAGGEDGFAARQRHVEALDEALRQAHGALDRIRATPESAELIAEHLRLAQQALSAITGEFTTEDLLGRIFSQFCIGK
ncbi:MAG: tRNA uridine-5-carboxymethylaminomethyl(34) synthesis GTPase MnmE [Gammaproteobacteria bacterium]